MLLSWCLGPKYSSNRAGSVNYTVRHTRVKVKQDSKPTYRPRNANKCWKKHRQSPKKESKNPLNTEGEKMNGRQKERNAVGTITWEKDKNKRLNRKHDDANIIRLDTGE